jgi:alpha-1,4-digalacturonate transport system substrate-binding protein
MPGEGTLDDPALSALVAFEGAASPEAVARVMEYLASTDVVHEFAARTLLIPAHVGVASSGVAYEIAAFPVKERFDIITSQVARLDPVAFKLLAYPYNQVIFDSIEERLGQAIIGELTIDEAIARIQEDIDYAIPEAAAR